MNHIVLIGRLTKDIVVLKSTSNAKYVRNTLAIDRQFNSSKKDFIPIILWKNQAEFAGKYLKKGQKVSVQGTLQSGQSTHQKTNTKITYHTVHVEIINSLEPKNKTKDTTAETVINEEDKNVNNDVPWDVGDI